MLIASTIACAQNAPDDRDVSWKTIAPNILDDQRRIWSFPSKLVHGHDLLPAVAFTGTSAALILLADPVEANYFRNSTAYHGYNRIFSSTATTAVIIAVPAGFYGVGLITHDVKAQKTALLAGEAVADAEILTTVLKKATLRERPSSIAPNGIFGDSWFEGGNHFTKTGSFPSGHTIAAFSVATVVARRYGRHRWVPWVAYGTAAAIGFSRMTLSSHYATDVFAGAVFGYTISRFAVLNPSP